MNVYPLPSDVLPFVPHRGVMLLLDRLEKVEPDKGQVGKGQSVGKAERHGLRNRQAMMTKQ